MDEITVQKFTVDKLNYKLSDYKIEDNILYIAPIKFSEDEPIYMSDAMNFFQDQMEIGGINARILIQRDRYVRLTFDSISLYLGLFIGFGISILGHLVHNLVSKRRNYAPDESIYLSFSYVDLKNEKYIEYSGDYSGLELITSQILSKYPVIENTSLEIIENINTGFKDSSNFCKLQLKEKIFKIIPLEINNLENFCNILQFLVNTMHLDANDYNFLNISADDFWEAHKDDNRISFETKWFQPKIHEILVRKFGEDVKKEVEEVRGSTDFLVHNIPIECKVITDKMKYDENIDGLEILEKHESQSFQETIHSRCGFLIVYDYRKEKIKENLKQSAVIERILFKIQGHKLIVLLVLLGNIEKPSK